MNKTIWKFPLPMEDASIIRMPHGAEVLCVQTQMNEPYIWAIVDNDTSYDHRMFHVRGTGHVFNGFEGRYVGTFQLQGGMFVFHVFEDINAEDEVNEISCQCTDNAPGSAPASWYEPEELKARIHAPNQCPGDVDLQLYRRGDQELWLCSACVFPSDVPLSRTEVGP